MFNTYSPGNSLTSAGDCRLLLLLPVMSLCDAVISTEINTWKGVVNKAVCSLFIISKPTLILDDK